MTTKERIIRHLDTLDESRLTALEQDLGIAEADRDLEEFRLLDELAAPIGEEERVRAQLEALNEVAGLLSDPDEYAEWERYARRRSLFGGRTLGLEPDEPG